LADGKQVKHLAAVVGAGPAGLFAARQLAQEGVHVVLFNRDIKPGGLAEYGIYPDKHKMKEGLRVQFRQTLTTDGIEYAGNLSIGEKGDLSLQDLKNMGFQAVLVTAGAQGTKWLGLPGEQLRGVYHAKDIVYHYNKLPPFSEMKFDIGRRVAVIGVGNVMLDIAHWLINECKVDEVIAIARRGPAEVKFTRTELEYVAANLDVDAYDAELRRVGPAMRLLAQDPLAARSLIEAARARAAVTNSPTRFRLMFLASPTRILGDAAGRVAGLEVENNRLSLSNGEVKARGLGTHQELDVDTVIFAIGDRVDEGVGLPVENNAYVKNPNPCFSVEGLCYEVFDPAKGTPIDGFFVAGWSRQASTGLVGVARKDGIHGARAVLAYLETQPPAPEGSLDQVHTRLAQLGKPVVSYADIQHLEEIEHRRGAELGNDEFKFGSNAEMLEAMGLVVKAPEDR
jgi:ferredoxin--NADP+ reductase